jgi:hypothetical protein
MRNQIATQPATRPTTVEPSRAWILGLVVEADGSVSAAPPAAPEWPASTPPDEGAHQILPPDGLPVRP